MSSCEGGAMQDLWCIECQTPASRVTHGTPPTASDHHLIDIRKLCEEHNHLYLRQAYCVRCGEPEQRPRPASPEDQHGD